MLTAIERDTMWKDVMGYRVPLIQQNLRDANALKCLEMLKNADVITDESYTQGITEILKKCGYALAPEDFKNKSS